MRFFHLSTHGAAVRGADDPMVPGSSSGGPQFHFARAGRHRTIQATARLRRSDQREAVLRKRQSLPWRAINSTVFNTL